MTKSNRYEDIDIGTVINGFKYLGDLPKDVWQSNGKLRTCYFECKFCNNIFSTALKSIKTENTKSCGCQRGLKNTKHGMSRTRFYKIWLKMKERCDNSKSEYFDDYGGRGVCYCTEWGEFTNFYNDMFENYSDDLELDRIDVNGNYSKENCTWSSESVQAFRQRIRSTNTTGRTGVYLLVDRNKYSVEIQENGKTLWLGQYSSFDEACKVREEAEIRIYGFSKK